MSKATGYYPKGPINQHKALASGAPLVKEESKDLDSNGWGPGGMGKGGRIVKSGSSTGSGYKSGGTVSHKTTPP